MERKPIMAFKCLSLDKLPVKVTVTEALDVDWCNLSQSVKALVEDGPQYLSRHVTIFKVLRSIAYRPRRFINIWNISSLTLSD